MTADLPLIIIDDDTGSRLAMESTFRSYRPHARLVGSTATFQEGLRFIPESGPALIVLGVQDLDEGEGQIQFLHERFPGVVPFVMTHEKNPDWILRLIRAGAFEYLLKPVQTSELVSALQKLRKSRHTPLTGPQPKGEVITVYNPVGGMGTTTIAVNLAATLAASNEKVALIDLNIFSGDVATFLDVTPRYTLSSVTTNVNRLDASFLMSAVTRHASGLHVLGEPQNLEGTAVITPEQVQKLLAVLTDVFSYTVIDTAGELFGHNSTVFKHSDHILFPTLLALPALKNAKHYRAAMMKHGLAGNNLHLIVNRHHGKDDIKISDAERVLDSKVSAAIPNRYLEVTTSINRGIPIITLYPNSPVTAALSRLVERLPLMNRTAIEQGFRTGGYASRCFRT